MKYFFSDNCYWDDKQSCVIRNGEIVRLSKEQTSVLAYLIKNNNTKISPAALYTKMTNGQDHRYDPNYKLKVADRISRKKKVSRAFSNAFQKLTTAFCLVVEMKMVGT